MRVRLILEYDLASGRKRSDFDIAVSEAIFGKENIDSHYGAFSNLVFVSTEIVDTAVMSHDGKTITVDP